MALDQSDLPLLATAALLAGLAACSMDMLSSVRALVGGEGLYAKAQKDAVLLLSEYARSHAEPDYQDFLRAIAVPMGDRRARLALDQAEPDLAAAREGLLAARNHPDDIDGMIRKLRWVSSRAQSVLDAVGKPVRMAGAVSDITERKEAEEALRLSRSTLRKLAEHQESVREDERKRIAREIHDDLGQNLLALRIDVSLLATQANSMPITGARIARALQQIDTTIKSVRGIINDLRPGVLDLGLQAAIEWQAGSFEQRSGIGCFPCPRWSWPPRASSTEPRPVVFRPRSGIF